MFGQNKKKLDLATAAKEALQKDFAAERKAHEAAQQELHRLKAENESMRTQLNKAVEVAGSAMNGRWYADNGRYCGEIKVPKLIQPTGTVLKLKINDKEGVTQGVFLPPDSTGYFQGNNIEWDNPPDETGAKIWERKDDPSVGSAPNWLQLRIEELQKERDDALAELATTTQNLQDRIKKHEADLEALSGTLNIDPSKVDVVSENRAMKVEIVKIKGDVEAYEKDLDAARRMTAGLREVIEGQQGEVLHARRQRTTWEADRNDLSALRASHQLAEAEVANLRKELEQYKKDLEEAQTKAEEAKKSDAVKNAELEEAKKKLEEENAAHEALKIRHMEITPENEALRVEADKQVEKAAFSIQAHEFVCQAHETLRNQHEKTSAEYGAMRTDHEKTREELQKLRQENAVVTAKNEHMEAHLKAITLEHDERKKSALDLVSQLEDLKIRNSQLERDNMEKEMQLSSNKEALQNIQGALRQELTSACKVFDTPYSEYLRATKGHASMGVVPSQGATDMAMIPGVVPQGPLSNPVFHPSVTQIVIGRVGQVVVEN